MFLKGSFRAPEPHPLIQNGFFKGGANSGWISEKVFLVLGGSLVKREGIKEIPLVN